MAKLGTATHMTMSTENQNGESELVVAFIAVEIITSVIVQIEIQNVKTNSRDGRKNERKREVVMGEVAKLVNKGYVPCQWYFASGSNVHITACKKIIHDTTKYG
ncbi:unnamed protein product [Albugo candida]|uniref:Uncharacterized protein n=1 Tax=Albugo candida TaxID=65357 RepID=A0A024GLT1_9STRA|nr:unnamed protein product [Albugo candida]|eukprot:CCI47297.1 unnamed protein product [Albugo candida]